MHEVPPHLARLIADGRTPRSSLSARALRELKPLFAGGAIAEDASGRGIAVVVRRPDVLLEWARRNYPACGGEWATKSESGRAKAVLFRRDSKASGAAAGAAVMHLRALGPVHVSVNGIEFPVEQLTACHGLAACLVQEDTRLVLGGLSILVENLACFLAAEVMLPAASIALNSAGRVSHALVQCLARSTFDGRLLHLPDYDPVGLDDYLRLKAALGERVALHVPADIEARFAAFGNKALITGRPRNRTLLEALGKTYWPCPESAKVFELIRESGTGLEQESLLLSRVPKATASTD